MKNYIIILLFLFAFSAKAQSYESLRDQGTEAFLAGDYQTAYDFFQKAAQGYPTNPEALVNYGYLQAMFGEIEVGIENLNKAILGAPDSVNWLISRAQVLSYSGDFEGSNRDYLNFTKRSENPEQVFIPIAANYNNLGDNDKALEYLQKFEDTSSELTPEFYYTKASAHLGKRDYLLVIQAATMAINGNPELIDSYFIRGFSLFQSGKYEPAIRDFDEYLKSDPESSLIWMLRGESKEKLDDLSGALADFQKSIELNSQNATVYLKRSEVYRKQGELEKALSDLNLSDKIQPNNRDVISSKASLLADMGKYSESIAEYSKAIQLAPKNAANYYSRSLAYLKVDRYQEALSDAKKSLELAPGNNNGYLNGATALFNLNQFSDALAFISEGISKNPNDGMMYYLRSAIHKELGNEEQAASDDAKAKELLTN
ncbi:tetratricopeptide repeat protein [Algoriphagus kandeliae]|uniref:Tetratricopeptide repeat protein n=1 Tax=Algoriphagus kandeliae TaxID=2562278 RepID=A0A4Y9QXE7_9BACT|nr:tetratricopeptide repeat protein [Algoriphagus kandeliae]TFV97124.1 tetratricopeptide repeat protein [Algoriphagus kandeliae]